MIGHAIPFRGFLQQRTPLTNRHAAGNRHGLSASRLSSRPRPRTAGLPGQASFLGLVLAAGVFLAGLSLMWPAAAAADADLANGDRRPGTGGLDLERGQEDEDEPTHDSTDTVSNGVQQSKQDDHCEGAESSDDFFDQSVERDTNRDDLN